MTDKPDHEGLYRQAEEQRGFFTAEQAKQYGFSQPLLSHHTRPDGRFERAGRGLYRLRLFPTSAHDDLFLAWLSLGRDDAVVSHESALDLYELADVMPTAVHFTVPRSRRWKRSRPAVRVHTSSKLDEQDVQRWGGLPVTTPERTIIDLIRTAFSPDQLEMAYNQANSRGLLSADSLWAAAQRKSFPVRGSVERLISRAA